LDVLTDELLECVPKLLKTEKDVAALILLFSGVDILGALETEDGFATKRSFVSWANRYMAPQARLGCTGLELYSARCGLIHARSARSALSVKGRARQFIFCSAFVGPGNAPGQVVVHSTSLWDAFRDGARMFVSDVREDKQRSERVRENLKNVYFTRSN